MAWQLQHTAQTNDDLERFIEEMRRKAEERDRIRKAKHSEMVRKAFGPMDAFNASGEVEAFQTFHAVEEAQAQQDFKADWTASENSKSKYTSCLLPKERENLLRPAMEYANLGVAKLEWHESQRIKKACPALDPPVTLREIFLVKNKVRAEKAKKHFRAFRKKQAEKKLKDVFAKRHDPAPIMKAWNNDMLKALWAAKAVEDMVDVTLELVTADHLSLPELKIFAQIVGHTSKPDYEKSGNGWHFKDKVEELSKPEMMFVVIHAAAGTNVTFAPTLQTDVIAFAAFRLDCDEEPHPERTLMYLWEIHVSAQFRGKGIASFLIQTVESIARMAGVTKVMLTVFTCNEHAAAVYYNLGYAKDAASPADRETRKSVKKAPYMLLSKDWWDPGYIPESSPTEIESPPTEIESPPTEIESPPTEIESPPQSEEPLVSDDQTSPSPPFSFSLPFHTKNGLSQTSPSSSMSFDLPLR